MTSVLMVTQVVMNIGMGWLADRWNRKGVLEIGFVAMGFSALTAWLAPSFNWFFLVMGLTGIANHGPLDHHDGAFPPIWHR